MTSGTWDRHSGRTDTYDVVGLGFNYRLDEPRAALLLSRLGRLEAGNRAPARADACATARCSRGVEGIIVPVRGRARSQTSSCYVMPIMLEEDGRQARGRAAAAARARHPDEHLLPLDPPLHAPTASASPTSRCRSPSWRRAPS